MIFFSSDLASGGQKKNNSEEFFFFNISRKNSKTSMVNQKSILNLYIFHHFPKNLDRTITLNSSYADRTSKIYYFFFQQNK